MNVWVGTSGWSYKDWASNFYPRKCPASKLLSHYITQFPTVEINATFYRLPSLAMSQGWHDTAPEGFLFAAKGSRYITHLKKLEQADEGLNRYFEQIKPLEEHTGPILWQLPPFLHKSPHRLEDFLQKLPAGFHHAFEFRHPSWICDEIFELLRKYNVASVWLSSNAMPQDFTITADFVYARFHGLEGGAAHDYTEKELQPWAQALSNAAEHHRPGYAYFNNDLNARAPLNAKMLMTLVSPFAAQPFAREPVPVSG
jgi:uncharacterized protein YecE (DUF72 family)